MYECACITFQDVEPKEKSHCARSDRARGIRFIPKVLSQPTVENAVRNIARGFDPFVNYPKIGDTPYSEYNTPFLFTKLFPHLFPGGIGDPTSPLLNEEVSLKKGIKHLLHLRYVDEDGDYTYPFAEDASFVFYAGNLLHRQEVIRAAGVFFRRDEDAANLTKEELEKLAESDFTTLMKKLGYYTGNVLMSPGTYGPRLHYLI